MIDYKEGGENSFLKKRFFAPLPPHFPKKLYTGDFAEVLGLRDCFF